MNIVLSDRQLCDLEMILNGGFAPLNGFLDEQDYYSVISTSRLTNGALWPIPIVLSISTTMATKCNVGTSIVLCNEENLPIAKMQVTSIYKPDIVKEFNAVFGCVDATHPYMGLFLANPDFVNIGGPVSVIQDVPHFDFVEHRLSPAQTRDYFAKHGWNTIVAFQTRNPMHRSHIELTKLALKETGDPNAKLLLHPVVGETQSDDIPYSVRVKCYKKTLPRYPAQTVLLALLPLSMRMAGPKEALWHALIRQNYGCTHFIVGRDHAGPSVTRSSGKPFFDPYASHALLAHHSDELSIKIVFSQMIVYVRELNMYVPQNLLQPGQITENISGTQQRKLLSEGKPIPEWFTYPEISQELQSVYRPKRTRGFCVYFVGLSGSGKTTLAKALCAKLQETTQSRAITLLDGDVVRQNLSKELGFSKEHRSTNVRRIGYVASEIVKHGGICLCANIAPYQSDRDYNRRQIEKYGGYIEVFVDTPLAVCEARDIKGFYKLARNGGIAEFTGVSDAFQIPESPDLVVSESSVLDGVLTVFDKLTQLEYL